MRKQITTGLTVLALGLGLSIGAAAPASAAGEIIWRMYDTKSQCLAYQSAIERSGNTIYSACRRFGGGNSHVLGYLVGRWHV